MQRWCATMICRLRTLRSGDVHISRSHMGQVLEDCWDLRDQNINLKLAKSAEERLTKSDRIAVSHSRIMRWLLKSWIGRGQCYLHKVWSSEFPWISTEVCTRGEAYALWAQPKFFTLSDITSYKAAFTVLHLCTFFSDFIQSYLQGSDIPRKYIYSTLYRLSIIH